MSLTIRDVHAEADKRLEAKEPLAALYLYRLLVERDPFDFDVRLRIADALAALGDVQRAGRVYTAVAVYSTKAGYPLRALVAIKVLAELDPSLGQLLDQLAQIYGAGSPKLGRGVRVAPTDLDAQMPAEALAPPPSLDPGALAESACAIGSNLAGVAVFPEKVPPIALLSELPPETFAKALGAARLVRAAPGELIIREGEPGTSFFVLARGTVRVFKTNTVGVSTDLARLGDGSIFGEMALVSASPRTASVAAEHHSDLIEWNRDALAALSREMGVVSRALETFTRERLLNNLMATSPLFAPFDSKQKVELLKRFTAHEVAPGTALIREGQEGRGLFLLLQGEVDVTKVDGQEQVMLATLKAGEVFGEIALIRGVTTTASVTAARPCTVMFLAREYVERVMKAVPAVKAYFEGLSEERLMDTEMLLKRPAEEDAEELSEDDLILI